MSSGLKKSVPLSLCVATQSRPPRRLFSLSLHFTSLFFFTSTFRVLSMADMGPSQRGPSRAQEAAKRGGQRRGLFQRPSSFFFTIVGADDDVFDAIDIRNCSRAQLLVLFLPAFCRSRRERSKDQHSRRATMTMRGERAEGGKEKRRCFFPFFSTSTYDLGR